MVVVRKPNGNLRIWIDLKDFYKVLKRSLYRLPTIEDILPDLSRAKVFSTFDVKNGFWHIELDDESSKLTTFNTPFGRYRRLRLPFGLSSAPEEFQRRQHQVVEGISEVLTTHDDILLYGETHMKRHTEIMMKSWKNSCFDAKSVMWNLTKRKWNWGTVKCLTSVISSQTRDLNLILTRSEQCKRCPSPRRGRGPKINLVCQPLE